LGLGYPPPNVGNFVDAIAALHGAKSENVIISTGSGEILTAASWPTAPAPKRWSRVTRHTDRQRKPRSGSRRR